MIMLSQKIREKIISSTAGNDNCTPVFFRINNSEGKNAFNILLNDQPHIKVSDTIWHQLKELVKTSNPSVRLSPSEIESGITAHLNGINLLEYGVWVYYPWKDTIVHILDEKEFVGLRTNRNKYKITESEQALLSAKTIGVIGLSVGQSIALTLAMERVCGKIRLADFDTADLSNLNRMRTGVGSIGLKKTVIAAREILEIDPFIDVRVYNDGVTEENINEFLTDDGNIDLLIEVCDGLDIKILSRFKARELRIPVVMDTNDRGMLDVERFDLEPDRPVLHGLAEGLDPKNIKGLTNEEKIPYILKMVGVDTLSTRLKASMLEVEQSISTWPQLASSVALGGGLTTDVCRRILLDQFHDSGRYYIDFDELVTDKEKKDARDGDIPVNPFKPLERNNIESIVEAYFQIEKKSEHLLTDGELSKIIEAAMIAPSAGNNQPWKWACRNGMLFLFHDRFRSWSWGDYDGMGSFMSLGTAIENVHLRASQLNLSDEAVLFPMTNVPELTCAFRFSPVLNHRDKIETSLAENLHKRFTNRKLGERKEIPSDFFRQLQSVAESSGVVRLFHIEDPQKLDELGKVIAACDKIRVLHEQGHEEFYSEIRWNEEQAMQNGDGIELSTVDLSKSEVAGFSVAKDWKAVQLLAKWDKGDSFMRLSKKAFSVASSAVIITIPEFNHKSLILAGRAIERAWIFANSNGVSVHPFLSSAFFFSRLIHGNGIDLPQHICQELTLLRERFTRVFEMDHKYSEVFLMKLSIADDIGTRSLRKSKNEVFFELD